MFLIRTRVAPSAIHGVGVFACEPVAVGATVWRFNPNFDRVIDEEALRAVPEAFRAYLDIYAYRAIDVGGALVLSCDDARFLNHSDDPNTEDRPFVSLARRPIAVGEEITCDYGEFCVGWAGFEFRPDCGAMPSSTSIGVGAADSARGR